MDRAFIAYKANEDRNTVKRLGKDMEYQSKKCSENCRYVMIAVFAALWAFIQEEPSPKFRLALTTIMFVCVLFMLINTWRYYTAAKNVSDLYRYSSLIDDKYLEYKTTELSDKTFFIQGIEVLVCTFVVLLLIAYVILRFVIYM